MPNVHGWREAVFVVKDLESRKQFYMQDVGWELIDESDSDSGLLKLWQLDSEITVKQCLLREPNSERGFIRLIELQGIEQEYIRANNQIWDTGGIYDVNARVSDSFNLAKTLHRHGWFGVNKPVEMQFGPFKVYEWLAKGHDGITFALIERLQPALAESDKPNALFSRVFNSSLVVKDYFAEINFFQQLLNFELLVQQHDSFDVEKSNVFGMPHNLVNNTPHHLTMLGAKGEKEGTIEVVEFPELTGNDFSQCAKAPNIGIVSLRFPVDDLDKLIQHSSDIGIRIDQQVEMYLPPYGRCKLISVSSPNNNQIEFFQQLGD